MCVCDIAYVCVMSCALFCVMCHVMQCNELHFLCLTWWMCFLLMFGIWNAWTGNGADLTQVIPSEGMLEVLIY